VYATAIVDQVAKPPKPVANFAVSADGLTVTCQNRASGQSGWWDFGDGSPLEPFTADQPEVKHTYDKAGNYGVKLTVRNFLMEENERAVPVSVGAAAAGPTGGPAVAALTVEPVGSGTAPATFKVKMEAKNAAEVILDQGLVDVPPEVVGGATPVEKLVVYEQPGRYAYSVLVKTGTSVQKKYQIVDVKPPAPGALSVVLKVTDSGTRAERKTSQPIAAVAVPAKPAGAFARVLAAEPGWTLASAQLGKFENKAVKNLKAELTPDRTAVKVSGEWTGTADAVNRSVGGSDLMIPVQVVQERTVPVNPRPQTIAAPLMAASIFDSFDSRPADWNTSQKSATLTLPPAPTGTTAKRTITLMLHEMDPQGRDQVVLTVPDLTKPTDEQVVTLSNKQRQAVRWEQLANGQVRVTLKAGTAVAAR
jgi:PKD repeat protein